MAVYQPSPVKRVRRTKAQLDVIDNAIVAAVEADRPVTLRGVYYRVVSAGIIGKTDAAYDMVGRELLKLRRAGRVSYSDITDGTRWVSKPQSWSSLDRMLGDAASSYRKALWHDQDGEVMIFTEKDAISGVLWSVTARWDVPLGVVRGYSSETFAWSVAQSIIASKASFVYVYQFGDHDPSGVNAWESFTEKVTGFVEEAYEDHTWLRFERLAVTPEQIEDMDLPTRPTKGSDSRAGSFSGESVEVDAIPAPILRELCEEAITQHIDTEQLRLTRIAEESERRVLTAMSAQGLRDLAEDEDEADPEVLAREARLRTLGDN